jgi:hypothetical protein
MSHNIGDATKSPFFVVRRLKRGTGRVFHGHGDDLEAGKVLSG